MEQGIIPFWEEGYLFVFAAWVAAAITLIYNWRQSVIEAGGTGATQTKAIRWIWVACILLLILRAVRLWNFALPDPGSALTISIGALFGIFIGRFTVALFRPGFPLHRFWLGALALLVLSIGYSLPLYKHLVADLLRSAGRVNTPDFGGGHQIGGRLSRERVPRYKLCVRWRFRVTGAICRSVHRP